jgi:hypothetical protein
LLITQTINPLKRFPDVFGFDHGLNNFQILFILNMRLNHVGIIKPRPISNLQMNFAQVLLLFPLVRVFFLYCLQLFCFHGQILFCE